ncbi:MAG: agmatine deiminase [Flavobacterium sp. MedPE-SWcel]|uniref:agmatine deiminase family protein n=1 Tax=uncultured Flavobacterium sp. TaxID=165435 RepID=UPI000914093C|nr:agmatine deiminase family protein [uncultured Flavobacterium sp.]OIQ22467.1 MAG: agmatine deiminase [Flavobacterium sp. MedPE-SWcel]
MTNNLNSPTPKQLGFHFPGEFAPQRALWLSWPHKEDSWPDKLHTIYKPYCLFILYVSRHQKVCINIVDDAMKQFALEQLNKYLSLVTDAKLSEVSFYPHPTNDAWCRDHGPAFIINPATKEKAIVNWNYNAWGNKYPPYDLDNAIPTKIAEVLDINVFEPNIVMEGGSVEFNGKGTLLTTTACLLNRNRNPHLSKKEIEDHLKEYYGVSHILWLGDGIIGDDTDGHIDDITRFVSEDTVVTVIEENKNDENYQLLQDNLTLLKKMKLQDGCPLKVIELPMPKAVIYEGERLPSSYANFYIANKCVIVPTYNDDINDKKALDILQSCFKDREVIGIDSTDIIWGLGSFHCLSQQEPV